MIAFECGLTLVLDYSRTVVFENRWTGTQFVHPGSYLLRVSIRGGVAPSRVAPAMVRRLALLGYQSSVLVPRL